MFENTNLYKLTKPSIPLKFQNSIQNKLANMFRKSRIGKHNSFSQCLVFA